MLYETQKSDQTYTNTLTYGKDDVTASATYEITEPANFASKNISINANTGQLTFQDTPVTVTVQATYAGKTATYTFTVADHFHSERSGQALVLVGSDMYLTGGSSYGERVWKSSDGGQAWVKVGTDHLRYHHSSVVINSGPNIGIYVIGGQDIGDLSGPNYVNDVRKSIDGGATWTEVVLTAGTTKFLALFYHSSVVVGSDIYVIGGAPAAGGYSNEVWKSTDGGATWGKVNTGTTGTNTLFSARAGHSSVVVGSNIYVIGGLTTTDRSDEVWESRDGGQTWKQVATGTRFPARNNHSAVAINSGPYAGIYVIGEFTAAGRSDEVWQSIDGGQNWVQVATGTRFAARHLHRSVAIGSAIYVVGGKVGGTNASNEVWKSINGGVTWKNVHAAP